MPLESTHAIKQEEANSIGLAKELFLTFKYYEKLFILPCFRIESHRLSNSVIFYATNNQFMFVFDTYYNDCDAFWRTMTIFLRYQVDGMYLL